MRDMDLKRESNREWAAANPQAKREASARYRAKRGPERGSEYNRLWRKKNILRALVSAARRRAIRDAIDFDPEILAELLELGVPNFCPVYGIEIILGGKLSNSSPSLDRISPAAGYVCGNVRVISWLANRHKNNATAEQHEAIARYMRSSTLKKGGVSALEIE